MRGEAGGKLGVVGGEGREECGREEARVWVTWFQ